MDCHPTTAEDERLQAEARRDQGANWKRWGPYISERQWGTVREDYSADGSAWSWFPYAHARQRAYRWGEDGLLGITDRQCRLCFCFALWNGQDDHLKERLFGLSNPQGNHGEDVKELYFYLDSTPTHSYMKALYKYPQTRFPYQQLADENARRGRSEPEYELIDTGAFEERRYFDVQVEYAKASPDDILIRLTVINHGPEAASLFVLPTLWFRNTWSWGDPLSGDEREPPPLICQDGPDTLRCDHSTLGRFLFTAERKASPWELLFTNNETNFAAVFGGPNKSLYFKDGFHRHIVDRWPGVTNNRSGTKAAVSFHGTFTPGEATVFRFRLTSAAAVVAEPFDRFDEIFAERIREANEFYEARKPGGLTSSEEVIVRQGYAGLLWNKQFYYYCVHRWLRGDSNYPPPPPDRWQGRNSDWIFLYNRDVVSMPDKWEFPWYAAWDLAFQMIPFARIDLAFAKQQLLLLLREWYMHPNGQLPAYEWDLGDANPPIHAWACWKVYEMSKAEGCEDRDFLARAFQKLLINFTWWVNRKDLEGKHIFAGGFLGLDNISLFDRRKSPIEQADGTAWMAFYCTTMMTIALELAEEDPVYEDMASKFFEHFVAIVDAMNSLGGTGLWHERDGFYYDQLRVNGHRLPINVRSMVGLIPLIACKVLDSRSLTRLPGFCRRLEWFLKNRQDLQAQISLFRTREHGSYVVRLLAVPSLDRLGRVLKRMLCEEEFLSPYGIRSLSREYRNGLHVHLDGKNFEIRYVPEDSDSDLFGGNSNWRGPVWLPLNYLLVEALKEYHAFFGDDFLIECPTGSGNKMNFGEVAEEISRRLVRIFLSDGAGARPCHGGVELFRSEPSWRNLILFHEFFNGDTGRGLGASHQTGWTALIIPLLEDLARKRTSTA